MAKRVEEMLVSVSSVRTLHGFAVVQAVAFEGGMQGELRDGEYFEAVVCHTCTAVEQTQFDKFVGHPLNVLVAIIHAEPHEKTQTTVYAAHQLLVHRYRRFENLESLEHSTLRARRSSPFVPPLSSWLC